MQLEHPSYGEMLDFYVEMNRQARQEALPLIPLADLQAFYALHSAPVPQLPTLADVAGAFVMEEDVVTREEAQQAFHVVKDTFSTMSDEHVRMKEGILGTCV